MQSYNSNVSIIYKTFLTVFAAAIMVFAISDPSFAITAAGNNIGQKLCEAAATVYAGNIGAGVATLAVVTVGIAACFGRASWTQAIVVAVGIAVVKGAAGLAAGFGIGC